MKITSDRAALAAAFKTVLGAAPTRTPDEPAAHQEGGPFVTYRVIKIGGFSGRDLTGQRFGRLLVSGPDPGRWKSGRHWWKCLCDCGAEKSVRSDGLLDGRTKSCGCLSRDLSRQRKPNLIHGFSHLDEHACWYSMNSRCCNPNDVRYQHYGGRGIRVCDRWKDSVAAFMEDIGPRPSKKHSVDRIDNDGDYCPENCRWATAAEQSRNSSRNRWIEHDGLRLTAKDWSERLGIDHRTLYSRLKRGLPPDQILSIVPLARKRRSPGKKEDS